MNTQTPTKKGTHRWLVAAPLFALCLALSMYDVFSPMTAAVVPTALYKTENATVLDTTSGAVLHTGTVMVSSEEWTTLTAGSLRFSGWNGSFQVTVQQGAVTVAALTTPVLISDGTQSALVPAFMQWKGNSLTASGDTLESWYGPRTVRALPSFFVSDALRSLPSGAPVDALSLPAFVATPDHFLVAAFHPLTRDHTRVLSVPALTEDENRLLLLLTPIADTLSDALSALALAQWQDRWMQFTQTQEGIAFFADALALFDAAIHRFDALQYPERVDMYSTAILGVADPLEKKLTPDARKVLQSIRQLRSERRFASPIPDPVAVSSLSSASSASSLNHVDVSPDILMQQAAFFLANAGFMSTSQTILKPVGSVVEVSDIVFGTANGDTTLHFTYDPVADLVSGIHQNGQVLPYAISLEKFTGWLRGE